MTRGIPTAIKDNMDAGVIYPFFAFEAHLDVDPLYFWTGVGTLTIAGQDYVGSGNVIQISDMQEGADLAAKGATVTLTGIDSDLLADALAEDYQGRTAKVLFGAIVPGSTNEDLLLFEDGTEVNYENNDTIEMAYDSTSFAFTMFQGRMDQMTIDEGPETSTIAVTIESRMIDLRKPRIRRYTDKDQQSRYSGDLAFEFVNEQMDESLSWGA